MKATERWVCPFGFVSVLVSESVSPAMCVRVALAESVSV